MLYGKEIYFGNLYNLKQVTNSYNCIVIQLLLNNIIELNGLINMDRLDKCKKKHLWLYFLYLSNNNPGLHPFSSINFEEDLFSQLKKILSSNYQCQHEYFLKKDIAGYINQTIQLNTGNINLTFIDQLIGLLLKKVEEMDTNLIQAYNNLIQKHGIVFDV